MAICIYPPQAEDFTTNGLGILTPLECTVEEVAAGKYELELVHPIDNTLRWAQITNGCILKVPAPVRENPLYEAPAMGEPVTITRQVWVVAGTTHGLYIRTGPGMGYKRIGVKKNGVEVLELEDADDPWKKVCVLNNGQVGYMSTKYLRPLRTETEVIEPAKPTGGSILKLGQSREQLFRIYSVEQDSEAATVTAKALHVFYDDNGNLIDADYEIAEGKTEDVNAVMANINSKLALPRETAFQAINLTGDITGAFSYKTPVEAYLDPDEGIVAQTKAMLVRDNWDAYLLPDMVRDRGVTVRRGKNLIGVEVTNDISSVVTRIIPVGKNKNGDPLYLTDTKYVDSPRIGDYPFPRLKRIEYDVQTGKDGFNNDNAVRNEIKRLAEEDFSKNGVDLPKYGMDVDFVLLQNTAEYADYASLQAVHLYDTVTVIDEMLGLKAKVRVTGYKWNCLNEQYESVTLGELQDVKQTVYSYNLPNAGVSGTKIMNNSLGGSALRNATIEYAKIAVAAIQQLTADSITALTARIQELVAGSITTDELYAGIADITKATIETADIDWASINELNAAIATLVQANIGTADIDFARIKDMVTDTAIITEGVGGQLFISRLAVTEANIVSLTTGELVVKGDDGHFYSLSVDAKGNVVTTLKQLNNDDVQDLSINAGEKLVEGSVTAACLNAREIFADNAVVRQLIAANLDVDTLFAREAFITLLRTSKIVGDKSIEMLVGETDNLNRLSNIEVIDGTFAQTERRAGEGIHVFSEFGPKQDLKWGNPYPGGAGKNMLSLLNGENATYSRVTPTVSDNAINLQIADGSSSGFQQWYAYFPIPETARGKDVSFSINAFTKNFETGNTTVIAEQFNSNKAAISGAPYINFFGITSAPISKSMLLNSSCAYIRIIFRADQGEAAPAGGRVWFGDVQLELGTTATSFTPYANTPAIEGWTGLNAVGCGKNLIDKDNLIFMENPSDTIKVLDTGIRITAKASGAWRASFIKIGAIELFMGKTFTLSADIKASANNNPVAVLSVRTGNNTNVAQLTRINLTNRSATVQVPNNESYAGCYLCVVLYSTESAAANTGDYADYENLMLEFGSGSEGYATAPITSYALQFGETVYGGSVNWHAGELVAEWKTIEVTEELVPNVVYAENGVYRITIDAPKVALGSKCISSHFAYEYSAVNIPNRIWVSGGYEIIAITSEKYSTREEWVAFFSAQKAAGTPVQISYKLAEPYTIQLAPAQIASLEGVNTVHTNADGGRVEFGHDLLELTDSAMEPLSPKSGALWLDRGLTPAVLRRYNGSQWETVNDVTLIETVQDALLTKQAELEAAQRETALFLKLDSANKMVRIGQTGVTSEYRIDAFGSGVVVNNEIFSRFEANRVLFGNMEMRMPGVGGLAFDSIAR